MEDYIELLNGILLISKLNTCEISTFTNIVNNKTITKKLIDAIFIKLNNSFSNNQGTPEKLYDMFRREFGASESEAMYNSMLFHKISENIKYLQYSTDEVLYVYNRKKNIKVILNHIIPHNIEYYVSIKKYYGYDKIKLELSSNSIKFTTR